MTDRLNRKTKLQPYHYSLCGAFSGVVTRAIAQPLDVLKIRFQLQTEPIRRRVVNGKTFSSKYSGIIQAANLIVKEEGITALWKGHVPAQGLSVIYGSSLFLTFELLKVLNQANNKHSSFSKSNFLYGGVAGIVATMCCHPLDVIRTRFVSQGEPKIYTSFLQGTKLMAQEGGILTFYKGLFPTLLAIFPNSSLQFGFYYMLKDVWNHSFHVVGINKIKHGKLQSLTCGALSGMISKVLLLPFDVVKKRLQIQGFEEARKSFGQFSHYDGMLNCFRGIVKEEGVMGLFKGTAASVLKSSVVAALAFFTYEQCCAVVFTMIE